MARMRAVLLALALLAGTARAAIAPPPEARAAKDRGDALRDAGDATGAIASYRAALAIAPAYAEAAAAAGGVQYAQRAYADAAARVFSHGSKCSSTNAGLGSTVFR